MKILSPVLALVAAITTAAPLAAQDTPPLHGRPPDAVYVRSVDGAERRGQLLRLGPDSLTILEQGTPHDIRLTDITRIDARGDSVKNGAIIGAVVLGAWCALICPQGLDGYSDNEFPYVLGINIALGAAVGAGIDGMHVGRTTIYQPPTDVAARRSPAKKVSLSMRFKF